ncbi:MAG: DUF5615 family PIN-like protein [Deltaproteobacteria bacterium]|nr:DUF5615 family PIN-like protein [Deltaproteobacteria bacterium]
MKLLLDQNISHRLVAILKGLFPKVSHVREHGLKQADDEAVWEFARKNDFMIVSKDSDFHQRSFLYGYPPKIIWLRVGNCSTQDLENIFRTYRKTIEKFYQNEEASFLILP